MNELIRFLMRIKENPKLYLGKNDIIALSHSISGYEAAIFDLTGKRICFNTKFQIFVEKNMV